MTKHIETPVQNEERASAALARQMMKEGANHSEIAAQLGMPKADEERVEKVLTRMEQADQ